MPEFNADRRWLGIPLEELPRSPQRLLGVSETEHDPRVLRAAAQRQAMHVRSRVDGPNAEEAERLLREIESAYRTPAPQRTPPSKREGSGASKQPAGNQNKPRRSSATDSGGDDSFLGAAPHRPIRWPRKVDATPLVLTLAVLAAAGGSYWLFAGNAGQEGDPLSAAEARGPAAHEFPTPAAFESPRESPPAADETKPLSTTATNPPEATRVDSRTDSDDGAASEEDPPSDEGGLEAAEDRDDDAPASAPPAGAVSPTEDDRSLEVAAAPRTPKKSNPPDREDDRNKDFVSYKGQHLSIVEFRNQCAYVDENQFTTAEAESAIFVEAKVGRPFGDVQKLSLMRHGEPTPLVCEVNRLELPDRLHRSLKENQVVWAYGWFTDPPTNEPVFEEHGFGADSDAPRRIAPRKRSFHLVATSRVDLKSTIKQLRTSVAPTAATPNVNPGQSVEVELVVKNASTSAMLDVEVAVVMAFNTALGLGQFIDRRIVEFDRIPPGQTATRLVRLKNSGAAFVPRFDAKVIHAVAVKE
jgi:hypothetical protein